MRIALLDNQIMLDGAQRFLVDVARGLLARKWEVTALLGAEGALVERCATLPLPVELLGLPAAMCQTHSPAAGMDGWRLLPRLCGLLRRRRIEVLYANSPFAAYWGGMACLYSGVRVIWRVHVSEELTLVRRYASLAQRLATQIHLAGEAIRPHLPRAGKPAQVRVLPPAIDLDRYAAVAPVKRKSREAPLVGMIGRWQPGSGQEVLLRAVRLLQDSGRQVRLCLVGEAQSAEQERYRSVMLSAVKAAGLGEHVEIRDHVDDLPAFLAACDIFAAPTLEETSGRLALEAAASGRPVIASRVEGLSGLIEDGHTGLLVPPNQPQALADALALLLVSPALCLQMGRQARVRCEEHFTLQATLTAIENLLHPHEPTPAQRTPAGKKG